jgi:hypothetical protein
MSLTDIVRTIAKNVRHTFSAPSELKEKAKDLPLNVLQTALTGVGQALMLSDRLRTGVKQLLSGDDRAASEARPAAQPSTPPVVEERDEKPARREPVIFAPRPSSGTPGESLNGATPKAEPAAAEPKPAPPTPEAMAEPATATAKAETAAPKAGTQAPKPETPAPKAETVTAKATAETAATKPRARKPRAESGKLAEAVQNAPEAPASAEAGTAAPSTASSPVGTTSTLAEPLPGYSDLTMASLRARLRGKSADQLRALIEYEQKTTARDDIVQMYAKRLAKLESGE